MRKKNIVFTCTLLVLLFLLVACGSEEGTSATIKESIASFEDVNSEKVQLIALGNSDVPVGQYAEEVFQKLQVWDAIQDKISFASTTKEVLAQVEQASVDCGVVYATDAATSEEVEVICQAPEDSLTSKVMYPVAIVSDCKNVEAAEVFMDFLLGQVAISEFEKVGFTFAENAGDWEDLTYEGEKCALNLYAAASLTESISAIELLFEENYPGIDLVVNLDSSGTLKTQIEEGAQADIFFSASAKQMLALEEGALIKVDTKTNLLENKIVLIRPIE